MSSTKPASQPKPPTLFITISYIFIILSIFGGLLIGANTTVGIGLSIAASGVILGLFFLALGHIIRQLFLLNSKIDSLFPTDSEQQ